MLFVDLDKILAKIKHENNFLTVIYSFGDYHRIHAKLAHDIYPLTQKQYEYLTLTTKLVRLYHTGRFYQPVFRLQMAIGQPEQVSERELVEYYNFGEYTRALHATAVEHFHIIEAGLFLTTRNFEYYSGLYPNYINEILKVTAKPMLVINQTRKAKQWVVNSEFFSDRLGYMVLNNSGKPLSFIVERQLSNWVFNLHEATTGVIKFYSLKD